MVDMKRQLLWAQLKAGLVITASILLLVATVFFAGGLEDVFSPKVELQAQIQDVKGLRNGAPVWVSGIEIGFVKDIRLHPEYGALVTLAVKKSTLGYLHRDSEASVMTMGLLGDKYIELSTGSPSTGGLAASDVVRGASQVELKDVMGNSAESLQRMSEVVKKLDSIITKIDSGEGTISRILADPAIYDNLQDATKRLSSLTRKMADSQGTMRLLIEDPALYQKMVAASSTFEELGRKANEGNGTLRKLLDDPALYDNLDSTARKLSAIADRVDRGEGLAGSLVSDGEISRDLKETILELKDLSKELGSLTKDIKENPKKYFKFSLF
jgi:phospholipid/cholesterol/gamma-HCH transport system substrate-binding protein